MSAFDSLWRLSANGRLMWDQFFRETIPAVNRDFFLSLTGGVFPELAAKLEDEMGNITTRTHTRVLQRSCSDPDGWGWGGWGWESNPSGRVPPVQSGPKPKQFVPPTKGRRQRSCRHGEGARLPVHEAECDVCRVDNARQTIRRPKDGSQHSLRCVLFSS